MAAERRGKLGSAQQGSGATQDGGDVYILVSVHTAENWLFLGDDSVVLFHAVLWPP